MKQCEKCGSYRLRKIEAYYSSCVQKGDVWIEERWSKRHEDPAIYQCLDCDHEWDKVE
jgi:hypothetical protein